MRLDSLEICELMKENENQLSITIKNENQSCTVINSSAIHGSVSEILYNTSLGNKNIILLNPYLLYSNLGVYKFLKKMKSIHDSGITYVNCSYAKQNLKDKIRLILVKIILPKFTGK